jgi:hypothetical protein
MLRFSLVTCALIALMLAPTVAQQPTQAQRDAVRAACRSDFMANCAGVQPGGKEALECLVRSESKLSAPCRSAVSAIANPASSPAAPVPAAAAPAATSNQGSAPAQDQSSTPAATAPATKTPATAPTRKTKAPTRATTPPAAAASATPGASASGSTGAPTVAPLGPIRPMLPRRALMVLAQCRPDQERLCAGVPPGGGKIFACLAANAQQLSPVCYDALARVSQ